MEKVEVSERFIEKIKPDFFLTPPIIKNWYLRSFEIYNDLSYIQKIRCIILLAIIGIENMGTLLNKENQVVEIVQFLKTDLEEIKDAGTLLEK